jgi:hypothetical protein
MFYVRKAPIIASIARVEPARNCYSQSEIAGWKGCRAVEGTGLENVFRMLWRVMLGDAGSKCARYLCSRSYGITV